MRAGDFTLHSFCWATALVTHLRSFLWANPTSLIIMRFKTLVTWSISLSYSSRSLAQSTLNPSNCVKGSGVTAFPNCNYLYDTINRCAGPSGNTGAPFIACLCNQALFNAYFGCESEQRFASETTSSMAHSSQVLPTGIALATAESLSLPPLHPFRPLRHRRTMTFALPFSQAVQALLKNTSSAPFHILVKSSFRVSASESFFPWNILASLWAILRACRVRQL